MSRKLLKIFVFIVDFILVQGALWLTLILRYGTDAIWIQWGRHFPVFGILSVVWFIIFYIADLYNLMQPLDYKKFLVSMSINVALSITFFYTFPNISISPKTNLGLVVVFFIAFFTLWRLVLERFLDRLGIRRAVVFVGIDHHALELAHRIVSNPRFGYSLTAYVIGNPPSTAVPVPEWLEKSKVELISDMSGLYTFLETRGIHTIVVSEEWYRDRDIHQHLYRLFPKGVRVFQLSTFWEQIEETIPINATDELWFLQNMGRGPYSVYHKLKRVFDIIVAVIFLLPILVLCFLTAVFVKITSKGPAIYKQVRVGLGNRNFTIYKFRSMRVDAEANGAVWASEKDPRLTPVGDFIRRFRLDELPQIFNVLKGDMSFIGPRPERPEFVDQLAKDIPHYNLRHLVKPGLSGWAQVKYRYGASVEDAEVKLMYDLFYVKNISPILDLKIALKTVLTIISKAGR